MLNITDPRTNAVVCTTLCFYFPRAVLAMCIIVPGVRGRLAGGSEPVRATTSVHKPGTYS